MAGGVVAFELAKIPGEGDLLLVSQILVAEHQHGMLVYARLDRRDCGGVERLGAIDAANLAGEDRGERTDRNRHWSSPLCRDKNDPPCAVVAQSFAARPGGPVTACCTPTITITVL